MGDLEVLEYLAVVSPPQLLRPAAGKRLEEKHRLDRSRGPGVRDGQHQFKRLRRERRDGSKGCKSGAMIPFSIVFVTCSGAFRRCPDNRSPEAMDCLQRSAFPAIVFIHSAL